MEEYLLVTHVYYVRDLQLNKEDTGSASRASNENSHRRPCFQRALHSIKRSDVKTIEILHSIIFRYMFCERFQCG